MMFPYGIVVGGVGGGAASTTYLSGAFTVEFLTEAYEIEIITPEFTVDFCECV